MPEAWLEELSAEECWSLLGGNRVGRIAFVANDAPVVFPVNYGVVDTGGRTWIVLRTGPATSSTKQPERCIPDRRDRSVPAAGLVRALVQVTLHNVDPDAVEFHDVDPEPWITEQRDAWLIIDLSTSSGRRLNLPEPELPFHLAAYL